MVFAADYPLLEIVWTMLIFGAWLMWLALAFWLLIDVVGRDDLSGWAKAGWMVLIVVVPVIGVLAYLIAHGERAPDRGVGRRTTREIASAKELLDSGAIDDAEFQQLKRRALIY